MMRARLEREKEKRLVFKVTRRDEEELEYYMLFNAVAA